MAQAIADGKLISIQLLRGIAASVVALAHIAFAFADHLGDGLGGRDHFGRPGQTAVMLFFVVSGYVMVVSSRSLFGQPGARAIFWKRRVIRIMPSYWIATLVLVGILTLLFAQSIDRLDLLRSAFLIPYWPVDGSLRAVPVLWPGWTLFFEMVFYACFGLFLSRGRRLAVFGTTAALTALTLIGVLVPPDNAVLFTITRPVLLVFILGMMLAFAREQGWAAPRWMRVAALVLAFVSYVMMPNAPDNAAMGFDYLVWCALPAGLAAVAVVGGELKLPFPRLTNGFGNMSYALYLLHLPIAWGWLWLYPRLAPFEIGSWDYFVTATIVTYVTSWIFYIGLEAPLTRQLNARLAARTNG